ncbi:MAG: lysylphosphatidylglycerol synthase transmembrane domain-containing protein [Flavobacteriaceae bacterium]|jgi:glycosyltransferase 2 family protein|nr:lysylphosphatidylglycerol synthase transmembrane domain-containing protein [Flavobacteriaceae bacterium]
MFKILIPLLIGFFFIYLSFKSTTEQDRENILMSIKNADYRYVLLSPFLGFLSHLSRAYRWKYLLSPLGYKPTFLNSTLSVFIAYIANLGIPRSGEIIRATVMSSYEKIPFEKSFGTIIAERIIDLIILTCFFFIALIIHFDLVISFLPIEKFELNNIFLSIFLLVILAFIWILILKKLNYTIVKNIKLFFSGLWEGIISLKKIEKKSSFIFHTFFIWILYVAMFYVIKWSLPETESLSLIELIPAFVIGGLTISATNGGIGIYPYSISLALFSFGISYDSGLAFGWIIWTAQTAMIIFCGGLSFFILPLVKK